MRTEGFILFPQGHIIPQTPGQSHITMAVTVDKSGHEDVPTAIYPFRTFVPAYGFVTNLGDPRTLHAHGSHERYIIIIAGNNNHMIYAKAIHLTP
jgi:hypothetical protein